MTARGGNASQGQPPSRWGMRTRITIAFGLIFALFAAGTGAGRRASAGTGAGTVCCCARESAGAP